MRSRKHNFIKGAKVVVSDHALMRYLDRCEIISSVEFWYIKGKADAGCKESKQIIKEERQILTRKFQNSRLTKFLKGGIEMRRELSGSKVTRCTFVAQKKGNTFILITSYLQGKKNDHWKIGINKEDKQVG